jgi:hypothetical protein
LVSESRLLWVALCTRWNLVPENSVMLAFATSLNVFYYVCELCRSTGLSTEHGMIRTHDSAQEQAADYTNIVVQSTVVSPKAVVPPKPSVLLLLE